MTEQKYPIGIQSFEKLRTGGYVYVDKTQYIEKLIRYERYYFLSRPRRFGKSLLLSTLHAYFDGRRDLFKGLWLDRDDVDWTPSPVLHFDFNSENYSVENGFDLLLDSYLREYEAIYGRDEADVSPSQRFRALIRSAYQKTGRRVVILIDEYDKPLLGIEENREIFEKNQAMLKSFLGNLKSMDRYIRFGFMTGVARFSKVSLFSDVNNLDDISMKEEYADICGLTEPELLGNFMPGIESMTRKFKVNTGEMVDILREYYDGYLFSEEGSRLYNPFSVLNALAERNLRPYWFESGTPTFLAKIVRKSGIALPDLNSEEYDRNDLLAVGLGTGNTTALMFQTGYLTIDSYDPALGLYKLRFPNSEVERGFARQLYPLYVPECAATRSPFALNNFMTELYRGHPDAFMVRLRTLFKDMTYYMHDENTYRSVIWLLCTLCRTETVAEHHSYRGRSDLEVETPDYIYVFEFKYGRSVEEAVAQLHERDYDGRYESDKRRVYLIAANLSADTRLLSWEILP